MDKLQHDRILQPTHDESLEKCKSCISGKMSSKLFSHQVERATDLLGIIHTDVFSHFRTVSRECASYFITFIDDFSRYGYVYLMKHEHEVFETFKGYALESAARILNMVLTKKVVRTPYEIWHGKAPKLYYLRVWDCEELVKRDAPDKLDPRSIKCIFVGYPKKTMGYYFYYPLENKFFVARNAEFCEKEDTRPSENTSKEHNEVAPTEVEPQNVRVPIHRSVRIPQAPDRYGFYVDVEEHKLGDLNEPPNYKVALLDPEFDKWLETLNMEMQSMKDNQVWILVDLPPNGRTVRSKWLFKKKTDMDSKQASRSWNKRFDVEIKKIGFTQNPDEPCVYLKASGSNVAFLILYVDDILLMGNNVTMLQEVKSWLCKCFSMKDLGEAAYILGIKIIRDRSKRLIALSQSAYLEKILKKFWMENSKKGAKQSTTAMYSTEAEYIVVAEASMEAVWMRKFIDELGSVMPSNKRPMEMLCNNEPAIAIADDPGILKGDRYSKELSLHS
ncbi:putative retrotransposon protein [Tanacetum coccineum]